MGNGEARRALSIPTIALIVPALLMHVSFLKHLLDKHQSPTFLVKLDDTSVSVTPTITDGRDNTPPLVIYRHTSSRRSARILRGLSSTLQYVGYTTVHVGADVTDEHIAARFRKPPSSYLSNTPEPKLLVVSQHRLTRRAHPERRAVIAAGIVTSLTDLLSYCVSTLPHAPIDCEDEVLSSCVRDASKSEDIVSNRYGPNTTHNADDYVDMPLASSHPVLSTAVLRLVFPEAPLMQFRGEIPLGELSDVAEIPECTKPQREKLSDDMESATDVLVNMRVAMIRQFLIMAGYPCVSKGKPEVTLEAMLDTAEEMHIGKVGKN